MVHHKEQINIIFAEIMQRDGIEGLRLGSQDTCGLQLADGAKLYFEYVKTNGSLYLYTPLMMLPADSERARALYLTMLSSNFLNLGAGKGIFAVFQHTQEAVYQIGLDAATLTVAQVDGAIGELLRQREEMLYQITQGKHGGSSTQGRASPAQSTLSRLNLARFGAAPIKR